MKKCTYCGFENEDDAMFCGGCGNKFEDSFEDSKEEFTPLIPIEVEEDDVSKNTIDEEEVNSNEKETKLVTDSEEEEDLEFDMDEPEDLGFEMEKELEEIDELDFGPEEEPIKEVKRPVIPPVVKQEEKVEKDLGFDLEEEPAEEVERPVAPRVNSNVQVERVGQPNKGIIIAVIIAGVAIIGAAGGGFMAYQNSKHQAEMAALKADQQKKEEEAQKEAEEAKKEMEAAKKEAEKAKIEAEKAREESKSNRSNKSSSSNNDDSDYDDYPDTGSYVANYNMKERSGASLSASQVGSIKKGQVLEIVNVIDNGDGSYWGELSNGHYVCIKDNSYIYLS